MVNINIENGKAVIALSGHVDSANAPEVDRLIFGETGLGDCNAIVVDAESLEYISSAGLRIILKIRKLCPELKIVGVSSEVYDVLEMTGFTEMITVEKAYRKL